MEKAGNTIVAISWSKWKWLRFLAAFYTIAVFTNMMGCSFYYLEPSIDIMQTPSIPSDASSLVFASCNNQNIQTPVFDVVSKMQPDLFVWTGDIIYPDWPIPWPGNNLDKIAHKYALLQNAPGYRNMSYSIPVTGIYDDHDFGRNNGGAAYPFRKESKQLLQQFLKEDEYAERSQHAGAYTWYHMQSGNLNYALILLDTRYFREEPGQSGVMLGNEQWSWLEDILMQPEMDFYIIVSGTSVLSRDSENEGWNDYPQEKEKLFSLLDQVHVPTVFVAGDKHYGEINSDHIHGKNYFELVASGITHTEAPGKNSRNNILHSQRFVGVNFGRILLPDSEQGNISIQVLDKTGAVKLEQQLNPDPAFAFNPLDLNCNTTLCACNKIKKSEPPQMDSAKFPSLMRTLQTTASYHAGIQFVSDIKDQ